jgi:hypothetical protein
MATRVSDRAAVPARRNVRPGYDADLYSWSMEQARLLRDGVWTAVDPENIADEIESLGREQFNKLESAFRILLIHMLKWDHQPQKRSRSWTLSVKEQRLVLGHVLADNPGLKPRIPEALVRAYALARVRAADETGLAEADFPENCPYSYEDIVSRTFAS